MADVSKSRVTMGKFRTARPKRTKGQPRWIDLSPLPLSDQWSEEELPLIEGNSSEQQQDLS